MITQLSRSDSSFDDPKNDRDDDKSSPPSLAANDLAARPAWKRALIGDAAQGHDTKRALGSRQIMMIGEWHSSSHYCIC